jgi:hypothetical protein
VPDMMPIIVDNSYKGEFNNIGARF